MILRKSNSLDEAVRGGNFSIDRSSAITGGFDLPHPDNVAELEKFRKSCPNYSDPSHGAHCERCDAAWRYPTGGVKWLHRDDWSVHSKDRGGKESNYPGNKFLEPIKDSEKRSLDTLRDSSDVVKPKGRLHKDGWMDFGKTADEFGYGSSGPEIAPVIYNHVEHTNFNTIAGNKLSNVFAVSDTRSKIEELPVQGFSVREDTNMNDYVRDLLRMSGGGALGGRDRVSIPDELMDAMAGDAAQEAILQTRVLEEMRRQATPEDAGGKYVGLDLMVESMSKGDVDKFLDTARKKIIKRSKGTRKGCCSKIGGILDQLMGPAGGEYGETQTAKDRGDAEPIGEAFSDDHKKLYTFRKGESRDGRSARIAHYKKHGKHMDEEAAILDFIAEEFSLSDHDADCEFAAQLQVESERGDYLAGPSKTAAALGSFSEAAHTGSVGSLKKPCYSDSETTRDDNGEYPTELRSLRTGAKYDSGKPKSPKGQRGKPRYDKDADPIGEAFATPMSDHLRQMRADKSPEQLAQERARNDVAREAGKRALANKNTNVSPAARLAAAKPSWGASDLRRYQPPDDTKSRHRERLTTDPMRARGASMIPRPRRKLGQSVDYDGPQISETASALASFMESGHTGSVGDLNVPTYDDAARTRDDNSDYPTALRSTGAGRSYDSGKPGSVKKSKSGKHRFDKDADPIGESFPGEVPDTASPARKREIARKMRLAKERAQLGREGWPDDAVANLERRAEKRRARKDAGSQMDDVDYDGPQISETAAALSGFMEASHTGSAGNMSPTPYWGPKKTRDDNRKDYLKTGLGSTKGEHSKGAIDPSNTGEKKARFDKGADPRGGATPKQSR